jgi:hypothetical protein
LSGCGRKEAFLALFDATALDMMKVGFFAMEDFSDFSKNL